MSPLPLVFADGATTRGTHRCDSLAAGGCRSGRALRVVLVGCERQARTHPATYRSCAQTDYPDVNRDSRSTEWIKKLSAPYERVRDLTARGLSSAGGLPA